MSFNIQQTTEYLARLSPQQLRDYTRLNKNNPYVVALAVDEANRRKHIYQAEQGAQGQMPQPKVVDTVIEGMAPQAAPMPEDQGIARLPAGPMNFADGGIVAFAGGGDVERYNKDGLIPPSAGTEYGIPGMMLPATSFMPQAGVGQEETPWLRRQFDAAREEGFKYQLAQAQARIAAGQGTASDAAIVKEAESRAAKTAAAPQTEVAQSAGATNRGLLNRTEQRMFPSAYATPSASAAADTGNKPPPAAPAAPSAGLPSLQDLSKLRQNIYSKQDFVDPAKAETEALGAEMLAGAQRRQKAFEDFTAKQGDVYKGREERIAKGEAELAGKKDQNLGLALLQAGAAMMSTPGSLGMAVGKAIDTGSKNYVAGLDKIQAAQERLADARDKMEELRLNRDDMTFKQRAAYEADIDRAKLDFKKLSIDGIRLAADVNEKRASDVFNKSVDLTKTMYEQQQATARAQGAGPMEHLMSTLGGGDVKKGMELYAAAMGPEAKGQSAILQKFATLEGQATLRMMEASNDPQQKALAQSIRAQLQNAMLTPTNTPGAGGARP